MIVNQVSSTRRLHPRYALGLIYLLLASLQPLVINAELNGVEACQNRCFNRSECHGISNGLCCRWDDDIDQCMSNIGRDICPGTETMMPPPPGPSIDCPPSAMSLVASTSRNLSNTQPEYAAPSTSPTTNDDRSCMDKLVDGEFKSWLEYYSCLTFTFSQVETMIITYKITAALSILGSSYVIQDVLRDPQKRNESTYHRIMLGLSCSDIIYSFFGPFLGTWVMPRESQKFAVGSNATCSIGGFFFTLGGMSTLLYSCSLATFYLVKLKYSWVNSKVKAIEKWLLFLPCTVGLIYASSAAAVSKLGDFGLLCVATSIVFHIWYWIVLGFSLCYITITMILVYMAVRNVEKAALKYTFARYTSPEKNNMKMSHRVMVQGILYSAVIISQCLTYVLVVDIRQLDSIYAIQMLGSIMFPLQGFWNVLIYMMPLFRQIIKKRCKSRQNVSDLIQDNQSVSKSSCYCLSKTMGIFFRFSKSTSKESHSNSSQQVEEVQDGSKKVEDLEDNDGVGVLKFNNTRQEEQIIDVNANNTSSELKSSKVVMFEEIKGDDSNAGISSSSLMLPSCVEQEETGELLSFTTLSQNSELKKEEPSQLLCFSVPEVNSEYCNDVDNRDSDSDDESYVDDYLKMMEIG